MKTLLICAAFAAGLQAVDAFAQWPAGLPVELAGFVGAGFTD